MKLNLLPTYVSKEKVTRTAWLIGIVILIVCALGSVGLYMQANKDLEASKEGIADERGKATRAVNTALVADDVIKKSEELLRNANLAQAMIKHNTTYPDAYDDVKKYIPSFFRVNSMSASPGGPGTSTMTLVGVLDTYQQYADVMLALLRNPKVLSISRTGFVDEMTYVPAPTTTDQYGKPHKPGEDPIPDDPLARLDYMMNKGTITGYTGTGGFGSGVPGIRGPMPHASQVTITMVLAQTDLQTPDPRATLALGSGGSTTPNPGTPNAGGGNLPANNTPPAPTGRNGRGGGAEDE